jgi:hypothetical protein
MNKPGIIGHAGGCGFSITFINGITASVIWNESSYTERGKRQRLDRSGETLDSENVEVMVSDGNGQVIRVAPDDDVVGYMTPGDLAALLYRLSRIDSEKDLKTVLLLL